MPSNIKIVDRTDTDELIVHLPGFDNFGKHYEKRVQEHSSRVLGRRVPIKRRSGKKDHFDMVIPDDDFGEVEAEAHWLKQLSAFVEKWETIRQRVLKAVFKEYAEYYYPAFAPDEEDDPEDAATVHLLTPRPDKPASIEDVFYIHTLFVGRGGVGLMMRATFEEEHGIGVLIKGGRVVATGHSEAAWDAHEGGPFKKAKPKVRSPLPPGLMPPTAGQLSAKAAEIERIDVPVSQQPDMDYYDLSFEREGRGLGSWLLELVGKTPYKGDDMIFCMEGAIRSIGNPIRPKNNIRPQGPYHKQRLSHAITDAMADEAFPLRAFVFRFIGLSDERPSAAMKDGSIDHRYPPSPRRKTINRNTITGCRNYRLILHRLPAKTLTVAPEAVEALLANEFTKRDMLKGLTNMGPAAGDYAEHFLDMLDALRPDDSFTGIARQCGAIIGPDNGVAKQLIDQLEYGPSHVQLAAAWALGYGATRLGPMLKPAAKTVAQWYAAADPSERYQWVFPYASTGRDSKQVRKAVTALLDSDEQDDRGEALLACCMCFRDGKADWSEHAARLMDGLHGYAKVDPYAAKDGSVGMSPDACVSAAISHLDHVGEAFSLHIADKIADFLESDRYWSPFELRWMHDLLGMLDRAAPLPSRTVEVLRDFYHVSQLREAQAAAYQCRQKIEQLLNDVA